MHVSPVCPGSAGQSLFAGFSRERSFSGLDLLASCQGPRSDLYTGVRRIQVGLLGRRQRVVLLLLPSVTCEKEPGHCGFLLVQARPFRDRWGGDSVWSRA